MSAAGPHHRRAWAGGTAPGQTDGCGAGRVGASPSRTGRTKPADQCGARSRMDCRGSRPPKAIRARTGVVTPLST
jgi:hypothetical protein